jgi:hypothetical protein
MRQDLTVNQGETWSFVYTHKDAAGSLINLTGYTARMMVKAAYVDGFQAYFSTGSDANGGSISLGGSAATVTLAMTADQSARLVDNASLVLVPEDKNPILVYRYDLELVSAAGVVTRVLEGRFILRREVTA